MIYSTLAPDDMWEYLTLLVVCWTLSPGYKWQHLIPPLEVEGPVLEGEEELAPLEGGSNAWAKR